MILSKRERGKKLICSNFRNHVACRNIYVKGTLGSEVMRHAV